MLPSTSLVSSVAMAVLALSNTAQAWAPPYTTSLMGCYSSAESLTFNDTHIYQSDGHCKDQCGPAAKAVMAMTGGTDCWCGDTMPPLSAKVDDSKCSEICVGWDKEYCGSPAGSKPMYYSVWKTGLTSQVQNLDSSSASASASPSPTTSSAPSVVTLEGQTVVVTASGSASPSSSSGGGGGASTAGIAAGVVVGVIAIAAAAGGIWFYMRMKRRKEVEEEYKRQAAVSAFVNGSRSPGSSAGSSHDTRLDPVIMTQRRMSDGSIADNQDYSRRILKVTNA